MNSMKLFRLIAVCLFIVFWGMQAGSVELTLSGADSRFLALSGEVELYLVATDSQGRPVDNLQAGDLILRDAPEGEQAGERLSITGFSPSGERPKGISFLLLIDDSGSMYDDSNGQEASSWQESRAALARREAENFLKDLGSSLDRAGLAAFGTHYRLQASPRTDRASLMEYLGETPKPEPAEAYTELYGAISQSAQSMSSQRGRRIVILFSDGEHFPLKDEQAREWTPDEALEALREEAVTLYAVRFGSNRDEQLARIARATGGLVYDVEGEEGLKGLYSAIRERVASEYSLSYRPRPTGAGKTTAFLEMAPEAALGTASTQIDYHSGFLFRAPSRRRWALFSLLAVPFALLLIVVMARLKAASRSEVPSLDRLRPVGGGAATVALGSGKTVITPGVSGGATTIAPEGEAPVNAGGATILVEKGKDGRWRASSPEGVVVNNQKSNSTVIENGDVIRAGDELIVFDEGKIS